MHILKSTADITSINCTALNISVRACGHDCRCARSKPILLGLTGLVMATLAYPESFARGTGIASAAGLLGLE